MRIFKLLLSLFVLSTCLSACLIFGDDDDDDHAITDLPAAIQDYIRTNYPDYELEEAEKGTRCTGAEVYEVELEAKDDEEIELVFDLEGSLLYEEVEIATSELPESVIKGIDDSYDNYKIEEAERLELVTDGVQYEVELEQNGVELEVLVDGAGTIVCEQVSDDD